MTRQDTEYSVQEVQDAHQALLRAGDMLKSNDLDGAIDACDKLIETYPDYFMAHVMKGVIDMQRGDYVAALPAFVRARLINGNVPSVLGNLGKVYVELGAYDSAIEVLEKAIELAPEEPMPHHFMGELHMSIANYELAAEYFEAGLKRDPSNSGARIMLGLCQASIGRDQEALDSLKEALSLPIAPDKRAQIFHILSEFHLKADDIDIVAEVDALEKEKSAEANPSRLTRLFNSTVPFSDLFGAFARGISLDAIGRQKDAWETFVHANKLVADGAVEERKDYFSHREALLQRAEYWEPTQNEIAHEKNADSPVSLFILGPSRAGKTTLERLIGSLPAVTVGAEHMIVRQTAIRTSHRAGLLSERFLANLPSELDDAFSETYHEQLKSVAGDSDLFTVAHPGVIPDVGRLSDLVPNAKFVLLRRNHDDLALRIFAYLYQPDTNQFAYDIKDIDRYIELNERMIETWAAKIPERTLVLSYEDIVEDPESALRAVAGLCGLKPPAKVDVPIPDDVGCAGPYLKWLNEARDITG